MNTGYIEEPQFVDKNWTTENSMIKVIGVGGGGCNAVTYMYHQKIEGCTFIVCNTDSQALNKSDVPTKIQLGEGLGAGTNPTEGRKAALDSMETISKIALDSGTKMLFITAGMGGGTGTGASPVIAKMAKDKGILTVGVVTLPFKTEGDDFLSKAVDGIHELEKNVDSLLIINNEKLYEHYGNQLIHEAFPKADEVLATAVRGIIEIITKAGNINVDFKDVTTMMKDGGMALMGCGEGRGENRLEDAVRGALESPLLNDFDLSSAKNMLLNITAGLNKEGLTMDELNTITEMVIKYTGKLVKFKRGIIYDEDPSVGDSIKITAIATGFKMDLIGVTGSDVGKLILIDKDFTYDSHKEDTGGEVSLTEDPVNIKINFNSLENVRKFHFEDKDRPVLALSPGESKGELENTAAIRRTLRTPRM